MRWSITISSLIVLSICWTAPRAESQSDVFAFHLDKGQERTVELTVSDGLRATRLHELPALTHIMVPYGITLTADDIDYLSTLTSLTGIEFGSALLDADHVVIEGDLSKLASLQHLEIVCLNKSNLQDQDLKFVASLPRLKQLEFHANPTPGEDNATFATDACAEHIAGATTLQELGIYGGNHFTDRFMAKATPALPDLRQLNLSSDGLTDESLRLLAQHCKLLHTLDLSSDKFTDEGIAHLARANNLQTLYLRSKRLTSGCVLSVATLQKLQQLQLPVPSIDDEGIRALAGLRHLETLVLREPSMTDPQFAMFQNHPALTSAFLNGGQLTKANVVQVIDSLPQLRHLDLGFEGRPLHRTVRQALTDRQDRPDQETPEP